MRSFVFSLKQSVSVGAALALLLLVGPTSPRPALAGEMGGDHYGGGHHGGGGGGGGIGGVGVGIGVGGIILNEAIRRSQERQATEPQGCPEGLVPTRHGCKPGKDKGPKVTQCEPPMQYRKGKGCVMPKGPDVAKCEPPMVPARHGKGCTMPKEPEVAKCEHSHGKGCEQPPQKTVSCDRPYIKVGKGCACPPGLIERGHDCRPPTVVIVPPPVVPVGPEEPPHVVPVGPAPEGPPHAAPPRPPSQQASPIPPPNRPAPIQSLDQSPAALQPLPAGRPLRSARADLRQTSGARSVSLGAAEARLLHAR